MDLLRGIVTLGVRKPRMVLSQYNYALKLSRRTEMNVHSEGKTVVNFLSNEDADRMLVMSYSDVGFRLTNNLFLLGPIVLFPKQLYSWNVGDASRVTPASTSLFYLLVPKVDLIVFGYGDPGNAIPLETRLFLQTKGINSECLPTKDAVATYNYLVDEGRRVAGAFIPPTHVVPSFADQLSTVQTGGGHISDLSTDFYSLQAEHDYIMSEFAHVQFQHGLGHITDKELAEKRNEIRAKSRRLKLEV